MPALYYLNSLFEYEIAHFPNLYQPSKLEINYASALSHLFWLLSSPEDQVFLPYQVDESLASEWKKKGLQFGEVYAGSFQPDSLILWGQNLNWKQNRWEHSKEKTESARLYNSKFRQAKYKLNLQIPGILPIFHTEMLKDELLYVQKKEFSFSGKGNRLRKGSDWKKENPETDSVWEEWREHRTLDFSCIAEKKGSDMQILGYTRMLNSPRGTYRGAILSSPESLRIPANYSEQVEKFIFGFAKSYEGPFSVDSFWFQDEREENLQYISEVNFRYSMGRILLKLQEKLKEDSSAILLLNPEEARELEKTFSLLQVCPFFQISRVKTAYFFIGLKKHGEIQLLQNLKNLSYNS
ncbi:MAG: hypothetical protein H7A25_04730 [Leptospiraceae bacterium]|nr:hypothetical protein [Leptospiraceae bacterium]MCP5499182.1 hypothetical protein [Leptospiraceae bacterium]